MTNRDCVCLVTESEALKMMKVDAQSVTTKVDDYLRSNLLGFYILVNTWLLLIKEYSVHAWMDVLMYIRKNGIFKTIRLFDEAANELIHTHRFEQPNSASRALPWAIILEVEATLNKRNIPFFSSKEVGDDVLATVLQLFRFPKRYSPIGCDKLSTDSITEFKLNQNRLKLLQRREHPMWFDSAIREEIANFLPWDDICDIINDMKLIDIEFTPGVGFEVARSGLGAKLIAISKLVPQYFTRDAYFTSPYSYHVHEGLTHEPVNKVLICAVPKNYKKARIIALENEYRQAISRRIFDIVSLFLPDSCDIHDQTRNQKLALRGSLDGSLATLDLTGASDDLQTSFIRNIFPKRFLDCLEPIRPNYYVFSRDDDHINILQSYMTMGNSMTFVNEEIVFNCIGRVAVRYYCVFVGYDHETTERMVNQVFTFGDDIIVPTECAETVIDFLTMAGFRVNKEKSFYDPNNLYRESCGEEYYNGVCVSSNYFPRFAVEGSLGDKPSVGMRTRRDAYTGEITDTTTRLIALQHKLYGISYDAARFLAEVINDLNPKITRSFGYEGSQCQDIWSRVPQPVLRTEPYGQIETVFVPYIKGGVTGKIKRKLKKIQTYQIESYSIPVVTYTNKSKGDHRDLYDCYMYRKFLRFGPNYKDHTCRMVSVSDPETTYDAVFGTPEISWKLDSFIK